MYYNRLTAAVIAALITLPMLADDADYSKMSSFIRSIAMRTGHIHKLADKSGDGRTVSAFVRIDGNADSTLTAYGCRSLARFDDIHIAAIPIGELRRMSLSPNVLRIETGRSCALTVDVAAESVNALPVYEGRALPQAYTGRGVVMGIMDVGFDLTHPNFYDATASNYRISRLWDQLSTDTVGSSMFVGAEYVTARQLLDYAHSRDGLKQTHGTHTLGIAAGGGYDSPYRGLAYESDICLVNNAVTSDLEFINEDDIYKYTYATDALGFKYIFDYAESQGRPCVISFSEGSHQDFRGDDQLYYDVLSQLTGPGRIIVSSAGNEGYLKTYINKPAGVEAAGARVLPEANRVYFTMKTDGDNGIRIVCHGSTEKDTLTISPNAVMAHEDMAWTDTVSIGGQTCILSAMAYPSCYDTGETACDIELTGLSEPIDAACLSVELIGPDTAAELYIHTGYLIDFTGIPHLCQAERSHSIYSPSSAPSVICVGATIYRSSITNYQGEVFTTEIHTPGERTDYSSVGPTYDGRTKPDVMAPGSNVISSYSSYYIEANPEAGDIKSDVAHFDFNGRMYAWNSNGGTSMSAPVVGGIVALWLEACPDLTPQDVLDVISRTSRRLDTEQPVPNNLWGYGEIDAYRGLLDILGIDNIKDIPQQQPAGVSIIPANDGRLRLTFSDIPEKPVRLRTYTTSGTLIDDRCIRIHSHETLIDVAMQPECVYAVSLTTDDKRFCGSTLVRPVK